MTRRKGEIGRRQIDRDFPHQVRILVPEGGLGRRLDDMHAAAAAIGAYLTRGDLRGAVDSVRFCFADRALALRFHAQWDGELIDV